MRKDAAQASCARLIRRLVEDPGIKIAESLIDAKANGVAFAISNALAFFDRALGFGSSNLVSAFYSEASFWRTWVIADPTTS